MEAVIEGLWGLADMHERNGDIGKAIKCLEAICQSQVSVLPILEVKTRLRIANILLKHSNNVNHAKSHLERSQLLLKSIPSCFELKCRAYSLLSQCYHLVGAIPPQKQILNKGIELAECTGHGPAEKLWFCNFISQLANTLVIEGDYHNSISALERGYNCASEACHTELQMFFSCSILHVHLMQWDSMELVEKAVSMCDDVWASMTTDRREQCFGLHIYSEFLRVFYLLRICDYKGADRHVEKLDATMRADLERDEIQVHNDLQVKTEEVSVKESHLEGKNGCSENKEPQSQYFGNFSWGPSDKIELAPAPINGLWLPKNAVYALVDLMFVINSRPKGLFKECTKRIRSGVCTIQDELRNLGVVDGSQEVQLQHSAIWMASVYLMLLMQFLENKIAVELTRAEFTEAQEALTQMIDWYIRFPTILQACECSIEMLRGQYAHCVGCFNEAVHHFVEASKLTESKSVQALCQVYAGVSYICIGDAESSSLALDLIGDVLNTADTYVGVREKTCVLFAHGLLLMKQQDLQDARIRLASGLQITHYHLGNLQLVSQYLAILGTIALALHDTGQARDILRSSFTLAKKLYDVPTQVWILSVLTDMYQKAGEKEHELENSEYHKKKVADLKKRLEFAHSSTHHIKLIEMKKLEANQVSGLGVKHAATEPSMSGLDIPESVGLTTPSPARSSMRLSSGRRGKQKI